LSSLEFQPLYSLDEGLQRTVNYFVLFLAEPGINSMEIRKTPEISSEDGTIGSPTRPRHAAYGIVLFVLIALCATLSLWPLSQSGFYSDDLILSLDRADAAYLGVSAFSHYIQKQEYFIRTLGRFVPLYSGFIIPYFLDELAAYKVFLMMMVVINIALFGYLIKVLTKDFILALLLMLVIPVFFQFRIYHDPLLSFYGHQQFIFTYLILSIIFLLRYLAGKPRYNLFLSVFLYTVMLYSYEIAFPLILIYILIILDHHQWRAIGSSLKKAMPFVATLVVALAANLIIRYFLKDADSTGYGGITANLKLHLIVKTFLVQAVASYPMSYFAGDPSHLFKHDVRSIVQQVQRIDILVLVIFSLLLYPLLRRVELKQNRRLLLVIGACLWIFPALMISLSSKYQQEFAWSGKYGLGHVPVYLQYYGTLMVFVGFLSLVRNVIASRKARHALIVIAILVLNLVLLINMQNNRTVVDRFNIDLMFSRVALEQALENGILQDVPDNAGIVFVDDYTFDTYPAGTASFRGWNNGYTWRNRAFIFKHARKKVTVLDAETAFAKTETDRLNNVTLSALYALRISSYPREYGVKEGFVTLGRVGSDRPVRLGSDRRQMNIEDWWTMSGKRLDGYVEETGPRDNFWPGDFLWTRGDSMLRVRYRIKPGDRYLVIRTFGYNPQKNDFAKLKLQVFVNGLELKNSNINPAIAHGHYYFALNARITAIRDIRIVSSTFTPVKLGFGRDSRALGIDVKDVVISRKSNG
jgi:hypothetical protein